MDKNINKLEKYNLNITIGSEVQVCFLLQTVMCLRIFTPCWSFNIFEINFILFNKVKEVFIFFWLFLVMTTTKSRAVNKSKNY